MTQALYRKWRPRRWEAVVGQEHVIQTLRNAVVGERVAHAYLFAGPRGTGKTSAARLLAKAVNCLEPQLAERPCDRCEHCQAVNQGRFLDLIEIDAASNTSVDDVRDLRDKINFSPNQARYKIYIVDEVHMLSTAAFNALLKTLEEPPPHAIFILATTEVHKIPATVLSRCQRHEFRRIPVKVIESNLKSLAAGEQIQVSDEALNLIARQATGSMRDAISLLDQLASTGMPVTLELVHSILGTAASQEVRQVIGALLNNNPAEGLQLLHQALDGGRDPRQFARQIVEYLRGLMLMQMSSDKQVDVPEDVRQVMARHALAFSTAALLNALRAFNHAATEARSSWQPALPLEMAFIEALPQPAPSSVETAPPPPAQSRPETEEAPPKSQRSSVARGGAAQRGEAGSSGPSAAVTTVPETTTATATNDNLGVPDEGETIQTLNQNWRQVLALVGGKNPNTRALLNSCRARYFKGNTLILGFASDLLKNQMLKRENLEIVNQALTQVLGREILVRCVISTAKRNLIPPEVDQDGMVAAALRDLGGEIVDVQ
jgi:DNA polymerase-3 subunit gamma/tau